MSVLEVRGLRVVYGAPGAARRSGSRHVSAVDGVDLDVDSGRAVGLVGASGAGKTTIARAIVHLVRAEGGQITAAGFDVTGFGRRAPLAFRRHVQMVFQRAGSSLNPALPVADHLAEPLRLHFGLRGHRLAARGAELLAAVGLPAESATRLPHQLSVGQRQRVAIARALATEPALIVLDEPVSALDAETRGQVISMLDELLRTTATAYLLITHDIAIARRLCTRISVLNEGRVVEEGSAEEICVRPADPYTALLVASAADADPGAPRRALERRRRTAHQWSGAIDR
jgi:peptide/nickel transport system ATP-binding protein